MRKTGNRLNGAKVIIFFLVACTRLYKPLCRLVGWSVGRSVAEGSEHATYGDWPCFISLFFHFTLFQYFISSTNSSPPFFQYSISSIISSLPLSPRLLYFFTQLSVFAALGWLGKSIKKLNQKFLGKFPLSDVVSIRTFLSKILSRAFYSFSQS